MGVGISPSLQKKIFEPYYQIGNKNTSLQGMGLGLPIVKKVVDSLAGEIVVESNPSQVPGTKVLVILTKHDLKAEDLPIQSAKEASNPNYQFADYAIEDSAYLPEWKGDSSVFTLFPLRAKNRIENVSCFFILKSFRSCL